MTRSSNHFHMTFATSFAWFLVAFSLAPFALADSPDEGSFESNGTTIYYTVEGEGPPVLLIHGYRADGNLNWRFGGVNNALVDSYRVITIDNRGHGKSDKPTAPSAYGAEMVEDQVRLLDHLGIEKAHVVGYSMGGMITLRLVVDHPERVLSAGICGMGWTRDDPETKERFRSARRDDGQKNGEVFQAVYNSWGALGVSKADLEAIDVPMIAIVGEKDGLYERSVKPLREVRPDVPLVLIDDATHASALMKPQFRQAIRTWLDEQPGG